MLFDVFFSLKHAVDLLRGDDGDAGSSIFELCVSRLQLSQLISTVGSPRAANEDNSQKPALIIR